MSLNTYSFSGNLGGDARVSDVSGKKLLEANVAVNIGYGDKQTAQWIRVRVWGKRAEGKLVDYLKKGSTIAVSGPLTLRTWEDKAGKTQASLVVDADQLDIVKSTANNGGSQKPADPSDNVDDIPFE